MGRTLSPDPPFVQVGGPNLFLNRNDGEMNEISGPVRDKTTESLDVGPWVKVCESLDNAISGSAGLDMGMDDALDQVDVDVSRLDEDVAAENNIKPDIASLEGFQWQFLANQWVLIPCSKTNVKDKEVENLVNVVETEDLDEEYGSDESITEFERSLKDMLPGLKVGNSTSVTGSALGTRKSERSKKPSTRWNEETGFVVEPPRSTKKRVSRDDSSEGMPPKPLLISDWSNSQIVSYCSACGILFDDSSLHKDACLDYIRQVEKIRSQLSDNAQGKQAETSTGVRGL